MHFLQYELVSRTWRRKLARVLLTAAVLIAVIIAVSVSRRDVRTAIRLYFVQRQCLAVHYAATDVVFEDTPSFSETEHESSDYSRLTNDAGICWTRKPPECWNQLLQASARAPAVNETSAPLFFGRLTATSGESQLVVICWQTWGRGNDSFADPLRIFTLSPQTLMSLRTGSILITESGTSPKNASGLQVPHDQVLKFYAGFVDPEDRSHFIVPYECGGHKGTLEGFLRSANQVDVRFVSGPAFERPIQPF